MTLLPQLPKYLGLQACTPVSAPQQHFQQKLSHVKKSEGAEHQLLTLVILATQEDQGWRNPISKKSIIKKGLVE
jgi:hypothetical protein